MESGAKSVTLKRKGFAHAHRAVLRPGQELPGELRARPLFFLRRAVRLSGPRRAPLQVSWSRGEPAAGNCGGSVAQWAIRESGAGQGLRPSGVQDGADSQVCVA